MERAAWLCWQLIDSGFPSGGFAHSAGLEAMRQHGLGDDELVDFMRDALAQWAHACGPFINAVHTDPHRFQSIDAHCDATLSGHVANRASRRQGVGLIRTAHAVFDRPETAEVERLCKAGRTPGHFAPALGAVCEALKLSRVTAQEIGVYMSQRAILSAATRLGMVGPLEAQRLLYRGSEAAAALAREAAGYTLEDVAQTAPLIELIQGTHDRLYSRLFQS